MQIHWLFILVGDNDTGKTTLQKRVIERLCGQIRVRLNANLTFDVTCSDAPRRLKTLSTANRSFQEKKSIYKTVARYFAKFFHDADAAIISSHSTSCEVELAEMIYEGKRRFYNVVGVFFSNAVDDEVQRISAKLNWDERIYLENPIAKTPEKVAANINAAANYLADVIIGKYSRK